MNGNGRGLRSLKPVLERVGIDLPEKPRERIVCAIGRVVLVNTDTGFVIDILPAHPGASNDPR